jgi:hypothetical protein
MRTVAACAEYCRASGLLGKQWASSSQEASESLTALFFACASYRQAIIMVVKLISNQ